MNRREFFRKNAAIGAALGLNLAPLANAAAQDAANGSGSSSIAADRESLVPEYFGLVAATHDGVSLKVGFAEADITPAVGMQMAGDYVPVFVKGFHDPCKVRAVVFDDGRTRVAVVGLDTLVAPESVVKAAREKIAARCGIAAGSVMVGAAHNHSSGPVGMVMPGEYDGADEMVRRLAYQESQMADAKYMDHVVEQIAVAVCEADGKRAAAICGCGDGVEDKVCFTRQFHMKNGLTYTHPGQGNPEIEGPAGSIDPAVGVIGVWSPAGQFMGCVVNYTCHATTNPGSGLEASANWIYYMERVIRGSMGANVPVVFLQGAAGNVTQVDNMSPYRYPGNTPWAEFVGGRVGAEAVKTLLTMVPGDFGTGAQGNGLLNTRTKVLQIPRRVPSAEHVRKAREVLKQGKAGAAQFADWVFAKETVLQDYKARQSPVAAVEVQAVQVGPVVFMANPAELFCDAGLEIKSASRFPQTCVVSYANGAVGYVPTAEDLGAHGGGYEARLTSYSNLEPQAAAEIVKASAELMAELRPGVKPEPERVPRFSPKASGAIGPNPWSYGDVPAELD